MKFSSLPIDGPLRITSRFGPRNTGIAGASTLHKGIDLGRNFSKTTTHILAVKAGTVQTVGWNKYRGWYVIILHSHTYSTLYQHLKERASVNVGQRVKAGDVIGIMGNSSDPKVLNVAVHLHFELHKDGTPIDPEPYLKDLEEEVTDMTESEIRAIVREMLIGAGTKPSDWATGYINEAKEKGITDGTRPKGYITREEATAMVMRALSDG